MSSELIRYIRSKRKSSTWCHIFRQKNIGLAHGILVKEPHKNVKKKIMRCSKPNCILCANPRKLWNEKTKQENIAEISFREELEYPDEN